MASNDARGSEDCGPAEGPCTVLQTGGSLPAELTTFVGRHKELAETRRLLRAHRLLTLTGIGGVGKTRLALRAAEKFRQSFPDGVWLVELAELSDASLLADVVAGALGVRASAGKSPEDTLVDTLTESDCLLVLDNCEQIVGAVAALCERLLRQCRLVHIMCTSREELRIGGEVLLRVCPLTVPGDPARAQPVESDAVTLFVERAAAAVPGFVLTESVQGVVADICRRLDGLPLAIELAAARLRTLSPAQILDRLADRFALLTHSDRGAPTRQQTLRLCMDWSYDLCSPAEQQVWSRLAFFAGSVDMEAAAAVCGSDGLLDLVTSLDEKSILVREESAGAVVRFRMLETLREYGQGKAREAGCTDDIQERLSQWYTDLAAHASEEFVGPRQLEWIVRIDRELPNFRDVLERQVLQDPRRGLRTAVALFPFWNSRGLFSEGRYWLDRLLAQDVEADCSELATLVYADCVLTASQGDREALDALEARARAVDAECTDSLGHGIVALAEGTIALFRADPGSAQVRLEESLAVLAAEAAPEFLQLSALTMIGFAYELQSDGIKARHFFDEGLTVTTARGESVFRSYLLWGTGVSLWRGGRAHEAEDRLRESLRMAADVGHPLLTAVCLEALAWITAEKPDARRAAALLGAADALSHRAESLPTFLPALLVHHGTCERDIRETLGKHAFALAYRTGAELAVSGNVPALLRPAELPAPGLGSLPAGSRLTRREEQVATLIGRGLTNRSIAHELIISERTVHGHVERILAKLKMSSRVQVAAWIAGRSPTE
ncbi:ATP-binding protein [Actinacidiphila glaucinigra]|uniref:ATP-binding protein n=1 Tax=Actinacidiphila glaucinigra TaxID=235986 RepID=UPI0035D5D776